MLGKLIKYEFKATWKIFLALYAALLVMAIVNMAILPETGSSGAFFSIFSALCIIVYVLLIVAIAIATLVVIIQRFYTNLLGDEGYLSFTLPVSTHQHIWSKLIVAIVWTLCSTVMVILSILIMVVRISDLGALWTGIQHLSSIGINPGLWFFGILVSIIIMCISSILQFYTAMSIGPHITKNRLIGSIIAYIGLYILVQIVSLISIIPLGNIVERYAEGNIAYYDDGFTGVDVMPNGSETTMVEIFNSAGFTFMAYFAILGLIMSAAFYVVTYYMLNKKLNLS